MNSNPRKIIKTLPDMALSASGVILIVLLIFLSACAKPQSDYTQQLKEWQEQQDNAKITALQKQVADLNSQLDTVKKQYSQSEADRKNLQGQVDNLNYQNSQLQSQIAELPGKDEITNLLNALNEQGKQYSQVSEKYITLTSMWQTLKGRYLELASVLRQAIASGNFTDNQSREWLDIIKPVE